MSPLIWLGLCISLLCKLILCIAREEKKSSVYAHTCYKFTINYMIALSVLYVAQTISEEKLPKQLIYGYSEHLLCNCTCQNSLSHIHSPPSWLFSFAGEQPRANEREQRNGIQKNSWRDMPWRLLESKLDHFAPFLKNAWSWSNWRTKVFFFCTCKMNSEKTLTGNFGVEHQENP